MESLSKMWNQLVMLKEIFDFERFKDEPEKLFTNNSKKIYEICWKNFRLVYFMSNLYSCIL